jgi:hypothetical protein
MIIGSMAFTSAPPIIISLKAARSMTMGGMEYMPIMTMEE